MIDKIPVELETIPCDLCGADISFHKTLVKTDRYGFAVNTVLCRRCGNMFINPRPTKDWYSWFYNHLYDQIAERDIETTEKMNDFFREEREQGEVIYERIEGFLAAKGKMLDVGCSLGGVAGAFQERGWQVWGIDPIERHVEFARAHVSGVFEVGSVEDFEPDTQFDFIVILRTLNHLLSPAQFLMAIKKNLKAEGLLYIGVRGLIIKSKNMKTFHPKIYPYTQIDHPYIFTEPILRSYLAKEGYSITMLRSEGDYIVALASPLSGSEVNFKVSYPHARFIIWKFIMWKYALKYYAVGLLGKIEKILYKFSRRRAQILTGKVIGDG